MGRLRKHSSAAHLPRTGMSVAYLQMRMGHPDPESALTYTHVSDIESAEVASILLGEVFS